MNFFPRLFFIEIIHFFELITFGIREIFTLVQFFLAGFTIKLRE